MGTHESSVNFQNLIRDLAEMYSFDIAEVVLIELVANSLDAGATLISIDYKPDNPILVVVDNGAGMTSSQFDEYHDFAAGLKTRGTGIGFAGVGAKIAFNIADRVLTETRSKSFCGGSNWYIQSQKKLVWENMKTEYLDSNGTRVEVRFKANTPPHYTNTKDVVKVLKRHYLPLLDMNFLDLYQQMGLYSNNLRFRVNGQIVKICDVVEDLAFQKVRKFFPTKAGKRTGYGIFGVSELEYPIGPDICGILLCTHGKVIKPDFFNQFPGAHGPKILGLVEVPGFIDFLTTAKTDFVRTRGKHREFESLYDPIRQEFKNWLKELGIQSFEFTETDEATRLEKELKRLVDDIPELGEFFGFRVKKAILQQSSGGAVKVNVQDGAEVTFSTNLGSGGGDLGPTDIGNEVGHALVEDQKNGKIKAEPISRIARHGPSISFVSAPERVDLAWVDGNNIVINSGHPSYIKTRSDSMAKRVHCFFAIGSAVLRFMATMDSAQDLMLIDRLMAAWGKK